MFSLHKEQQKFKFLCVYPNPNRGYPTKTQFTITRLFWALLMLCGPKKTKKRVCPYFMPSFCLCTYARKSFNLRLFLPLERGQIEFSPSSCVVIITRPAG